VKTYKFVKSTFIIALLLAVLVIFGRQARERDTLYQVSVLSGLMQGDYDGKISLNQIRRHGDFGLGTFERLDGEAIELDGIFYQVRADGAVRRLSGQVKSPFMMVTFFDSDLVFSIPGKTDYRSLQEFIESCLPTKNIPYAVKIDGKFDYIKVRSVPAQSKPYPLFSEVAKKQSIFEFSDIEGTLVGFRMPDYMQGVNIAGYHLHFLSRDKTKGGHLLECRVAKAQARVDSIDRFIMALPESKDFYYLDFSSGAAIAPEAEKSE